MPAMPTMTINNMTGIFMYIDALSSGWFGILLPISLFVILILSFHLLQLLLQCFCLLQEY